MYVLNSIIRINNIVNGQIVSPGELNVFDVYWKNSKLGMCGFVCAFSSGVCK